MAQSKNPILRVVFAVVLLSVVVIAAWAIMKNTGRAPAPGAPAPTAAAPAVPPGAQAPSAATPAPGETPPTSPAAPATAQAPTGATPAGPLAARPWKGEPLAMTYEPIGSLDPKSAYEMHVEFTPQGAGVRSIKLSGHFDDLKDTVNTEIQHAVEAQSGSLVPMAALWVDVNGAPVNLVGVPGAAEWSVWKQRAGEPGAFDAEIADGAGAGALKIERRYELAPNSHRLGLRQTITNVSSAPVRVRLHQYGPIDLTGEATAYGGDRRRVRFGYLLSVTADPTRRAVMSSEFVQDHQAALGSPDPATHVYAVSAALWPNPKSGAGGYEMVWSALTGRYFAVAVHGYADPTGAGSLAMPRYGSVERFVWNRYRTDPDGKQVLDPMMALRLASDEVTIAPGASADLSLAAYAGPISRPLLKADPVSRDYGLGGLVLFNMYTSGSWWCCCTWPPVGAVIEGISAVLFWLMHVLHDYLVLDWSLAIVLLVVCVRTVLHPLTKWSQVRMQRFGKQMQNMGPKQKQIQERFRDDKKRLQEEMAKLWREEGVSPLGMIGCAPMVLVTPIWIGLYAMLYFAFELRHAPAFFGLIQKVSPTWSFLADLSEPDRLVNFGRTLVTVPLLGPISAVNILPLILGAVFYVHQKYLTPPSTAPLTPEQEMQQKMVKIMSVVMFPLFMYNAPSGMAIYFITNSTLAIFENKYIRAHIDKHDLLNHKKKPGKPDGLVGRLLRAAEERARAVDRVRTGKK